MAEGLRPHHHQEFEYHTIQYFDKKRHVIVKKIRHEKYDCYVPPPKSKTKALERNKRKYSNRDWYFLFLYPKTENNIARHE